MDKATTACNTKSNSMSSQSKTKSFLFSIKQDSYPLITTHNFKESISTVEQHVQTREYMLLSMESVANSIWIKNIFIKTPCLTNKCFIYNYQKLFKSPMSSSIALKESLQDSKWDIWFIQEVIRTFVHSAILKRKIKLSKKHSKN